jgi:hypothetical protein
MSGPPVSAVEETAREGGGGIDVALWAGVFAGPFAFAVDETVSYSLAPTACVAGAKLPLHVVALVTFAVALAGLAAAWRAWRRVGRGWGEPEEGAPVAGDPELGRRRFMAVSGLALSAGFALTIVALEIPNLVLTLQACR